MNISMPVEQHAKLKSDPDWWRGAVIYQIYPRSFQDSNGDGIGDLSGIIHRLPYVASLGVDAIWISPFFTSPMLDFGYDVSDYRNVDPMFGTLGDFDALVDRAHDLGLRVMIDLVLSHTSSEHVWFQESRSSHDNPKSNWYVWADAKPDGTPPNNWLSIFGGSAWQWDGERRQYYLHNFLVQQPDLNFHEPEVQEQVLDVARFWLDRGVDGFRLDTINFYVHDKELRDNPALDINSRNASIAPDVNPYNYQNHLFDKNQPENLAFLERFRALMDDYTDIAVVGEVGEAQIGLQIVADYTRGDDRVHMCYAFDFLGPEKVTGTRAAKVLRDFDRVAPDGWQCYALSNHDTMRMPSRWNLEDKGIRSHVAFLMCLRGSICLYQGEELGLTEAYVPYEELQDPYGKAFWPKFKGRDGCRTPMPWAADGPQGGFSDHKPWLPMAMEHLPKSVARQDDDTESLLNWYRDVIALRRMRPVLMKGDLEVIEATDSVITFTRRLDGHAPMFCAFNFTGGSHQVTLPEGEWAWIEGLGFTPQRQGRVVTLPPYQVFLAEG
ncbi:alpha-glucosidase [Halovulum sp. GXIMD14794]